MYGAGERKSLMLATYDASMLWNRDKPGLPPHEQSEFVIRGHR